MFGVEQKKVLKHVSTRWLSIGRSLERLLENWDPLKVFFREESTSKEVSAYAKMEVKKDYRAALFKVN
jgi:hypothetical protein